MKEALQICRNVLGGCGAGESITFVTGRGAHSEGLLKFLNVVCLCLWFKKRWSSENSKRFGFHVGWDVRHVLI